MRKWTIKQDNLGFRYQSGHYNSSLKPTSPHEGPTVMFSPPIEEEPHKTKSLGKSTNSLFKGKMSLKGFAKAATFDGLSIRARNTMRSNSIFYEEPQMDITGVDLNRISYFFTEKTDLRNRLVKDFFLSEWSYFGQLQMLSHKIREIEPLLLREGLPHHLLNFGEVYLQAATIIKHLHAVLQDFVTGTTSILPLGHVLLQLGDSFKYYVRYCLDVDAVISAIRSPRTDKIPLSELAGSLTPDMSTNRLQHLEDLLNLPRLHVLGYPKRLREIQNETGRLSLEHVDIEQVTQIIEQIIFRIQNVTTPVQ